MRIHRRRSICSSHLRTVRKERRISFPAGQGAIRQRGTGDAGFMLNYEFNAMSDVSILCGQEFTRYRPYNDDPEETELDLDGFCWEELLGNCLAGLAAVGTVTALAAYGASVVLTGGATAAFASMGRRKAGRILRHGGSRRHGDQ